MNQDETDALLKRLREWADEADGLPHTYADRSAYAGYGFAQGQVIGILLAAEGNARMAALLRDVNDAITEASS